MARPPALDAETIAREIQQLQDARIERELAMTRVLLVLFIFSI